MRFCKAFGGRVFRIGGKVLMLAFSSIGTSVYIMQNQMAQGQSTMTSY